MANFDMVLTVMFPNQTIPPLTTFRYACPGASPGNIYVPQASSSTDAGNATLAVSAGWEMAGANAGPTFIVTNQSSTTTANFDLSVLQIIPAGSSASDLKGAQKR